MKSFIVATLVAAAAAQAGSDAEPLRFTSRAQGPSGTDLNTGSINANGGHFWVGKDTKITVPAGTDPKSVIGESNIKNGNTTIFKFVNSKSTLDLDALVPQGQAVFVDAKTGKLGFTKGGAAGKGAGLTNGFTTAYDATITFEKKEWLGCGSDQAGWEVYAASRAPKGQKGCQGFTWKIHQEKAVYDGGLQPAYEYV